MKKLYKVTLFKIDKYGLEPERVGKIIAKKGIVYAKDIKNKRKIQIYDYRKEDVEENVINIFSSLPSVSYKGMDTYGRVLYVSKTEFIRNNLATKKDIDDYLFEETNYYQLEENAPKKYSQLVKRLQRK